MSAVYAAVKYGLGASVIHGYKFLIEPGIRPMRTVACHDKPGKSGWLKSNRPINCPRCLKRIQETVNT